MKTQLTTLHDGNSTAETTTPVPRRKSVLVLLTRLLWAASLLLSVFVARAGVVLTTLHSFQVSTNGAIPFGLLQGSDGNFYGTTEEGGVNGFGTVFQISTNGDLTRLYSFTGYNDGAGPGGLAQGSDGNFYGTTTDGGTNSFGTVFQISTNGALTTLYAFGAIINAIGEPLDGANPGAGLVQGSDGYFYGMTSRGGTGNRGTVFKISTNGVLSSLYSFTGGKDGANPHAGLVHGSDGYFYGTTSGGGAYTNQYGQGFGTVFKISAAGTLTSLYSFTNGNDGGFPISSLVQGSNGYFYGTTEYSGTNDSNGTVFKVSTNGALTTLYSFTGGNDGSRPAAGLVQGSDGNFYGTTSYSGTTGYGTVFQMSATGALTIMHSFAGGNDGGDPNAALVQGIDGNFYGTTAFGGEMPGLIGIGTVFKISATGVLTTLYAFPYYVDGAAPSAPLVEGSDGNFYGTTSYGGTTGYGTVFQMSATGALTIMHSFAGGNDGGDPNAALVQGIDGNFYGTTSGLDFNGQGTVFKISTNGALTSLYSFTGGNDGGNPDAALVLGSDGYFYGTTVFGGTNNSYYSGTVFKISTNGALTSLYSFTGGNDGGNPDAALVLGSDGYFYGTTSSGGTNGFGTVFQISPNGTLTSLYSFGAIQDGNGDALDGAFPQAGLVQGSDGYFYGTTSSGGTNGFGTMFKISANGTLTSLYSFGAIQDGIGDALDGANPQNGVVQGSDGYFYGTSQGSGTKGLGNVFKISTNGTLTTLYYFTGHNDGGVPNALMQGRDGYFYGTSQTAGQGGAGTVFRMAVVPEFQAVTLTNSTLKLTWCTEAGGMYQLQYDSDMRSGNWTNVGSPVTASGATLTATDSVNESPQRFYRVVLLP